MKRFEDGSGTPGTRDDVLSFLPVLDLTWDDLVLPSAAIAELRALCLQAPMGGVTAAVSGPAGCGKTIAVRACAEQLRLDVWQVDCALLVRLHGAASGAALPAVLAVGARPHALMLFHEAEWLFEQVAGGAGSRLLELAVRRKPPTVLESRRRLSLPRGVVPAPIEIALASPGRAARAELWRRIAWRSHPLLELDVDRLAAVPATGKTIEDVLEQALAEPGGVEPTTEALVDRLWARARGSG